MYVLQIRYVDVDRRQPCVWVSGADSVCCVASGLPVIQVVQVRCDTYQGLINMHEAGMGWSEATNRYLPVSIHKLRRLAFGSLTVHGEGLCDIARATKIL